MRWAPAFRILRAWQPRVVRTAALQSPSCGHYPLHDSKRFFSVTRACRSSSTNARVSMAAEQISGDALLHFAKESLPIAWMSTAQFSQALKKHFHSSDPAHFGCSTLLELVERHPHIFESKTGKDGRWVVRLQQNALPKSEEASGTDQIVRALKSLHAAASEKRAFPASEVFSDCDPGKLCTLDELAARPDGANDVRLYTALRIRPKAQRRNAYVFVDGDELPRVAIRAVLDALALNAVGSTVVVARRSASSSYSAQDRVTPDGLPTYTQLEKEATRVRLLNAPVLKDVLYVCSGKQFELYESHVARANDFPDADVYVCCPSRIKLVSESSRVGM